MTRRHTVNTNLQTLQVFKFTSLNYFSLFFDHTMKTPSTQPTGGRLHMGRYTAGMRRRNKPFTAPPSERREIWAAIIGSPHMYSPQCAPRSLRGEHFDDNLPHYTLTFPQWLHAPVFIAPTPNGYLQVPPLAIWSQINRSWHSNLLKSSPQFCHPNPPSPERLPLQQQLFQMSLTHACGVADKMNTKSFSRGKIKILKSSGKQGKSEGRGMCGSSQGLGAGGVSWGWKAA